MGGVGRLGGRGRPRETMMHAGVVCALHFVFKKNQDEGHAHTGKEVVRLSICIRLYYIERLVLKLWIDVVIAGWSLAY